MTRFAPPTLTLADAGDTPRLQPGGDWVVASLHMIESDVARIKRSGVVGELDVSSLGRLDTAGALLLSELTTADVDVSGDHPSASVLLAQVRAASAPCAETPRPPGGVISLLESVGRSSTQFVREMTATLAFFGETMAALFAVIAGPSKIRWKSVVAVMEEAGLNAITIVMFLSFFVGMVVAYIGATTLKVWALEIYTAELIGFSMLREFGVVITGIVLAGRTNSSFTAQIGTMKMRQEVDAMRTLGLLEMETLVVPRIIAMVVMTPLLSFAATLAGLAGGALVGWTSLDVDPGVFMARIRDYVPVQNFWVGMSKAPVFGLVVALIACRHGLATGGSVQSLGSRVTTSVVQAIFAIIVIDALFAIFYMEMGI